MRCADRRSNNGRVLDRRLQKLRFQSPKRWQFLQHLQRDPL